MQWLINEIQEYVALKQFHFETKETFYQETDIMQRLNRINNVHIM